MSRLTKEKLYSKILGSLCAAGMGDALGAPTELYSIDEIKAKYHGFLDRFVEPPKDTFAGSLNGVAGLITDDASQMYVLSEGLIEAGYGNFTNQHWLKCLLRWADMQPYANYKGPTTEMIVNALHEGRPTNTIGRIGQSERQAPNIGTTNGAGMRIAPAGLVYPGNIDKACELAFITCIPSHDTNIAIASACAIAAGVSQAMMPDANVNSVVAACLTGAVKGEALARARARSVAGPSIEKRIQLAVDIAGNAASLENCLRDLEGYIGNSVAAHESIPTAIGLFVYAQGDVWQGIVAAANVGNDTDSIATMVGALSGALNGFDSLPQAQFEQFYRVNGKDFNVKRIAEGLTELAWQSLREA